MVCLSWGKDVSANYEVEISGKLVINPSITYILNGKENKAGETYLVENNSQNPDSYEAGKTTFTFKAPKYAVVPSDGSGEKEYEFLGWYTDQELTKEKSGITTADRSDITVYAKWRAVGRIRYYLESNGEASWALGAESEKIVLEGSGSNSDHYIDIVQDYTNGKEKLAGTTVFRTPGAAPARTGYTFDGWWNDSYNPKYADKKCIFGGEEHVFNNGGNWSTKNGNPDQITFRAQWLPFTYTVTFDPNGGSGAPASQAFTYGTEGSLNRNGDSAIAAYTRDGYVFAGWAAAKNAAEAAYKDGDTVSGWKIGGVEIAWPKNGDGTVDDGAELTLYAVWKPDIRVTLTGFDVVYDGQTHAAVLTGTLAEDAVQFYTLESGSRRVLANPFTAKNVGASMQDVYADVTRGGVTVTVGPVRGLIRKRPVVVTSGSAEKTYDGEPLTKHDVTAEPTAEGRGWVTGEGADYAVSGTQTLVGSSENRFTWTAKPGTDPDNYTVTPQYGTLTVTGEKADPALAVGKTHADKLYKIGETVTFTVTAKNIYAVPKTITLTEQAGTAFQAAAGARLGKDGTEAVFADVQPGMEVRITAVHIITDEDVKNGSFKNTVKVSFAGETTSYTGEDTVEKIDRSCTYRVEFRNQLGEAIRSAIGPVTVPYGTVVTGRTVTTLGSGQTAYQDIAIPGYKFKNTSPDLTVTTDTGKNIFIVYYQADMAQVRVAGFEKVYDGKEYAVSVSGTIPGDTVTYTYQKDGKTVTTQNSVRARDVADSVAEVTVSVKRGTAVWSETVPAVIKKRRVVLESASLEKVFDGSPLRNGSTPLVRDGIADEKESVGEDEGWVPGEGLIREEMFFYGEITEPTSIENVFDYSLTSGTKEENYDIKRVYGSLTITGRRTPYEITVEANSGAFTYDGARKEVSGFFMNNGGEKINGVSTIQFVLDDCAYVLMGLQATAVATDAGTYTVEFTGEEEVWTVAARSNVTDQFKVNKIPGTLKIAPRPVTITSGSAVKEYDGKPLTNSRVTAEGFVGNDGADGRTTGSQTLVGSSENTFTYELRPGTKAANYAISVKNGTLTVTDRTGKFPLVVEARSAAYLYDGTEKTENRFVQGLRYEINGETYTVEGLMASGAGKNAGTYEVKVAGTPVVRDKNGNDVTAQFAVQTKPGELTIQKRPLTLVSASLQKEYDGSTLTNGDTELDVEEGWADGEGADYVFTGSQTQAGSRPNAFEIQPYAGTDMNNYEVDKREGTLTVTNRGDQYEITVRARSASYIYDGAEKQESRFETLTFTVNGHKYTVEGLTASGAGKDAGTYGVEVAGTPVVRDQDGNDVTAQFHVNCSDGSLVIKKRTVILRSADKTRPYDGTPLKNGDTPLVQDGTAGSRAAGEGDGWADGEGADYTFTGSQTTVGSSENAFTYTLKTNTNAGNYEISRIFGTLTVTERTEKFAIDVTAVSGEYLYDGAQKTASGFTQPLEFEINGQKYVVSGLTASAAGTNAGTYKVEVAGTARVLDANGNDVTGEFSVNTHDGELKINPRRVILTSNSAVAKYDGMTLSDPNVTVTGDGFAEGEAEAKATGGICYVGSVPNTIEVVEQKGYRAENYTIEKNEGTLRITDADLTESPVVKSHEDGAVYRAGDTVVFTVEATNIYNEPKTITLTEQEGVTFDAADGVTVSADGRTARAENVQPGDTVRVEAHYTVADQDVKNGSFSNTVTASYSGTDTTFTGTDTVDEIDRNCSYIVQFVNETNGKVLQTLGPVSARYGTEVNGDTVTEDGTLYREVSIRYYTFVRTGDPLTVTTDTEKNVFIVYYSADFGELDAEGVDKTYDGKESAVSVLGTKEGDEVTYKYTVTDKSGQEKTVTAKEPPVVKNVGDSIGEVTVTVTRDGESWSKTVPAVVTAAKLTLKSGSLEKRYDGRPLTNGNLPLELEEGWMDGEGAAYVFDGAQTDAGSSRNTFYAVPNEGTDLDNYEIEYQYGTLTVLPEKQSEPETESEKETESEPETESEIETESEPETESEIETESEPETESEIGTESESETESEIGTESEPETESETETESEPITEPETEPETAWSVTVTKKNISAADGHRLALVGADFYIALFADAGLTQRVGEIQSVHFDGGTWKESAVFALPAPGRYYVAEVDADGNVADSGAFGGGVYVPQYADDAHAVRVTAKKPAGEFAFENLFLELPDEQYYQDMGAPEDETEEETEVTSSEETEIWTEEQTEKQTQKPSADAGATDGGSRPDAPPATGDTAPLAPLFFLLLLSGAVLMVFAGKRRGAGARRASGSGKNF